MELFRAYSLYWLSMMSLFLFSGCKTDTELLKKPSQEVQGLYVINVLDKNLYNDCHIKGSINVPFDLSLEKIQAFVKDLKKNTELVVYCSNYQCTASGLTAKKLKNIGFSQVWAYEGGTAEWFQEGLPVEGPCKQGYLKQKVTKFEEEEGNEYETITAQQLYEKMKMHNLL